MTRQTRKVAAAVILAAGLAACGGGSSASAPSAVPTPPTKAAVTFNVDPNPVVSEYQGDGWWRFRVNLEFYDTAGVGFTINSVRTTIQSSVTSTILLDQDYAIARHVDGGGRTVLQFTSGLYRTLAGGGANVKLIANITDDKGNGVTLSNQASVTEVGGPRPEPSN
jgi:hypothetical protein